MGSAEWLGAASLVVALVALIVAGIAAANQIASLKKPLPTVRFTRAARRLTVNSLVQTERKNVLALTLVIMIRNEGHETMLHPRIYDWTSGRIVDEYRAENPMPSILGAGQNVDVTTNYKLRNHNDRIIGVVWEEVSLFRRKPITKGIRFHLPALGELGSWPTPAEYWKRVGPFAKKGWQQKGGPLSLWQPVFTGSQNPGSGHRWSNFRMGMNMEIARKHQLFSRNLANENFIGQEPISSYELERLREEGLSL